MRIEGKANKHGNSSVWSESKIIVSKTIILSLNS
jgi:hypothetical protein